jgi:lipopolysaccharide transport system permease protein
MMRQFSCHPVEVLASPWRHRELILASAKREVLGRYRGSVMGIFWSFLSPLIMLFIYTFVFSEILKSRWNAASESKTEFALVLFIGLIAFNLLAECVNRAPGLILSNVNYVKKMVFPLEILPCVVLVAALFHALISLGVWMLAYMLLLGLPQPSALYLPLVMVPFLFLILGLTWVLASFGVFLRDISQLIGMVMTALMFLSPIFYPASALPEHYQFILYLNPLTPVIEEMRAVLFWGQAPDFAMLAVYWLATALLAWLGFVWFQKTRNGFADVL